MQTTSPMADGPRWWWPPAPHDLAALAFGAAVYWLPRLDYLGYCEAGQYVAVAQVLVMLLLGVVAGLLRLRRHFCAFGGAGFGLAWGVDLLLSLGFPGIFFCSHQLLPLEAAIIAAQVALPTWLGSAAARALGRRLPALREPGRRWRIAYAPLAVAALLVMVSPHLLPLQLKVQEQRALATIATLAQAQFAYRESHPAEGFACSLAALSADFAGSAASAGNKQGFVWRGGYRYRLHCRGAAVPRAAFTLEAVPYCRPTCGTIAYCVDQRGEIRALPVDSSSRGDSACGAAGRPLARPGAAKRRRRRASARTRP